MSCNIIIVMPYVYNTSMTTSGEESVSLKKSCPNFKHLRIGPEDDLRLNPPSKK